MDMRRGTIYSAILHIGVACLLIFGVPVFMNKEVIDSQPMIVEMVQIADKTNPPPSQQPRQEAPKPTPKPPEEKPQPPQAKTTPPPPAPEAPPEPQVAEKAPEPPPKPEALPKPPEPKPEPKAEVKKPEPPPPPKETATPPPKQVTNIVPQKKPTPPKPKKEKQQPKRDDFINSILKDVAPTQKSAEKADKPTPQKTPSPSPSPPSLDQQVTMSEIDAVRRQISECWNMPAGARDAENLIVTIRASVAPDGTVTSAVIENNSRMGDPFYRAAAESAKRAMLNPRCQPLKLPPQKYEQWKNLRIDFNPKDMIG
jgi:hypothetical protein